MTARIVFVVFVVTLCLLATEIRSASRPSKSRDASFNFYPSITPPQYIQPQIVQLDMGLFAVVDIDDLMRIAIFNQTWSIPTTFSFNIQPNLKDFAALSAPDNSVMIILPEDNFRAIVVNKQGQITSNRTISTLTSAGLVNACRINKDLFALVEKQVSDLSLRVYDNNFNVIDQTKFNARDINVASDGTYLYYGVLFYGASASVFKVNPNSINVVISNITDLEVQDSTTSMLLSIFGNQLLVTILSTTNRVVDWTLLDLNSLAKITSKTVTEFWNQPQSLSLIYPAYTNDGYLCVAQKLDKSSWIETSVGLYDSFTPQNTTLWNVADSQTSNTATSRYFLDVNRNGYILPMKDYELGSNLTIIVLQFFGEFCGDNVPRGAEQCDSGEFCTITCQCQPGYRPTSPMSSSCIPDTTFTDCDSCEADEICLESRGGGTCSQYRIVPILQCVQTLPFGAKRAFFAYQTTQALSISTMTSNNIITPSGTPNTAFTSSRSIYPGASFTADFMPDAFVEYFVDGMLIAFNSSDQSLACPKAITLRITTAEPTDMEVLLEQLVRSMASIMKVDPVRVTAVQVMPKKRQLLAYVTAVVTGDPSDPYAVTAVRQLLNNIPTLQAEVPEVQFVDLTILGNEKMGRRVEPAPPSQHSPSEQIVQPESGPNGPPSGWSNDYIAIIVVVPLGIAAIIFLAVFLSRRKAKKGKKQDKIPLGTSDIKTESSSYTVMPEMSPQSTARSDSGIGSVSPTSTGDRMHVPYSELKFKTEIGAGAYGKVFIGEWQRIKVALKINTSATGDDFAREARLMVDLRPHPNVVQMLGVSSDGPYPVMILEFCDGGSLDDKLFDAQETITPQQQLDIVTGIAKGLYHLHKNQIVHRDLAARNILMSHDQPKISDFGLSRQVGDKQKGTTKSTVGPIRWMAPESLQTMSYSTKSDVWTFGVVVSEIVARQEPHIEADQMAIGLNIRDKGVTPTIPSDCDPVLKDIMTKCWQLEPNARPTMEQICDILDRYLEDGTRQ